VFARHGARANPAAARQDIGRGMRLGRRIADFVVGSPLPSRRKSGEHILLIARLVLRGALICVVPVALLAACVEFEAGIDLLPSPSGWQSLPLRGWVLNEGLGPVRIAYCPAPRCAEPSVVATVAAQGEEARRLERALANPKTLFTAKRVEVATARDPRLKRSPAKTASGSAEHAERFQIDGLTGYRITISPKGADGHAAYAVVLAKHEDDAVKIAFAVSTNPDTALQAGRAAALSF
jgi:hypothetical protein